VQVRQARSFGITNNTFLRDGSPFRILSGSLHYHRVLPELWEDRISRMAALGLNAIQVRG